jgi:hypothetical protein
MYYSPIGIQCGGYIPTFSTIPLGPPITNDKYIPITYGDSIVVHYDKNYSKYKLPATTPVHTILSTKSLSILTDKILDI